MIDDRSEAYRAMCVRYKLKKSLTQMGEEPSIVQISFIQDCIELAKLQPNENTNKIIQDAFKRTQR